MKFLASTPSPNAPLTPYPQYGVFSLKIHVILVNFILLLLMPLGASFCERTNPYIIHAVRKFLYNLGQLYQYSKAVNTASLTPVVSIKHSLDIPDKASPAWQKLKPVSVNSLVVKSFSI